MPSWKDIQIKIDPLPMSPRYKVGTCTLLKRPDGGVEVNMTLMIHPSAWPDCERSQLRLDDPAFLRKLIDVLDPRHDDSVDALAYAQRAVAKATEKLIGTPTHRGPPNVQNLKRCYNCARGPEACVCPKGLVPA